MGLSLTNAVGTLHADSLQSPVETLHATSLQVPGIRFHLPVSDKIRLH